MPEDLFPEMVGASENRVSLAHTPTEVEVALEAPSGPLLGIAAEEPPQKVYLKIENVKGQELSAPSYLVHVNLPPGADPAAHGDRLAGRVSMFGVLEASDSEGIEAHSGSGLTFSFDITDVARRLQEAGDWDLGAGAVEVVAFAGLDGPRPMTRSSPVPHACPAAAECYDRPLHAAQRRSTRRAAARHPPRSARRRLLELLRRPQGAHDAARRGVDPPAPDRDHRQPAALSRRTSFTRPLSRRLLRVAEP